MLSFNRHQLAVVSSHDPDHHKQNHHLRHHCTHRRPLSWISLVDTFTKKRSSSTMQLLLIITFKSLSIIARYFPYDRLNIITMPAVASSVFFSLSRTIMHTSRSNIRKYTTIGSISLFRLVYSKFPSEPCDFLHRNWRINIPPPDLHGRQNIPTMSRPQSWSCKSLT